MKLLNISMAGIMAVVFVAILAVCFQLGATERKIQVATAGGLANNYVQCNTPRPEICYELYQPVCAKRDTGRQCTTMPCLMTEMITYSNDCKACADTAVMGFVSGGSCNDSGIAVDLVREAGA